jgi:anthranilate phosphoribosyltransferase
MAPVLAGVFANRGVDAWVFRGDDGLDELTTTTSSSLWNVHDGIVEQATVHPSDFGLPTARPEDLRGGNAAHNASVVQAVLAGETGPIRDAVVLNAGAALAVYDDPAGEFAEALAKGVERAAEAIDSGAAAAKLAAWVEASASV